MEGKERVSSRNCYYLVPLQKNQQILYRVLVHEPRPILHQIYN